MWNLCTWLGSASSSSSVCEVVCGVVHLASSPPPIPIFSSFHCFISVTGAWNGGSWLGCGDLPAMGAVFYLGAGWTQCMWKPLGIPGTHLPLKQGSWLIAYSTLNIVSFVCIYNNYSPQCQWLVVDIYRTVKQGGKYPRLATDTEVTNCFSIY